MRTTIKTTNLKLTPEISDYLQKRISSLEKVTTHHSEAVIVDVEIGRTTTHHQTGDIYRAEINVHIGNRSFRAVKETSDLFSSIDASKDQMMEELRADKDRRLSRIRQGGQQIKAFIKDFPWWGKRGKQ